MIRRKEDVKIRKVSNAQGGNGDIYFHDWLLPEDAPYAEIAALRLEARQKLAKQKPRSLAAASRIPGVSPADIAVLMVWLEKQKG